MQRAHVVGALALAAAVTFAGGCTGSDSAGGQSGQAYDDAAKGVDPSTVKGSCSLLLGPDEEFVDDALAAGAAVVKSNGAASDVDRATAVQNNVFKLVAAGPAELQEPAGQLVDYLDDPLAYQTDGKLDPLVTDAVAAIKKLCAG